MIETLITSRKNEMISHAAKLLSGVAARREQGAFLCEGARLCADAAKSGMQIQKAFYTAHAAEKYPSYLSKIREKAEQVYEIAPHIVPLLSDTKQPQGIFCVCTLPRESEQTETFLQTKASGCVVALEEIQDPANLGTVLRTAEALGEKAVLLCGKCCDPYSPKVLRGSMGAVFRLPMISIPNFAEAAPFLKKCGWTLWAAVPDSDALAVTKADFSKPSVMAVGNEGNGLSKETIALCQPVTIPMLGRAESLNASASAAILLWEMMREGASRE